MSTNLFAPQIRPVQPAFDYAVGKSRIYFTPSIYNENIINLLKAGVLLLDPNKNSADGNNIILELKDCEIKKENSTNSECYIEINLANENLAVEQYYQVQICLSYGVTLSPYSQVSLIKPVYGYDGLEIEELISEFDNYYTSLTKIKGRVIPVNEQSKDYLQSVQYSIYNADTEELLYTSPILNTVNGFDFECKIDYPFVDGGYYFKFTFTSINEYINDDFSSNPFGISEIVPSVSKWDLFSMKSNINTDIGSIDFNFQWNNYNETDNGICLIQRSDGLDRFINWKNIVYFKLGPAESPISLHWRWRDSTIEGGRVYQYRVLYFVGNKINVQPKYLKIDETQHEVTALDYIYLSDAEDMLAIQYNPSINNYKWVVQESISNTLGGTYPIIRSNGNTKYRQFNISGSLYFNPTYSDSVDSCNKPMQDWFSDDSCGLYLAKEKFDIYKEYDWNSQILAKKLKDLAIQFLTNKKVKMFRSQEEGNMIVYLSNISFSPNTQLSNQVYGFSATVTEVAAATEENLRKYNFNFPHSGIYTYTLDVKNTEIIQNATATIDSNQLLNKNFSSQVILIAKEVGTLS